MTLSDFLAMKEKIDKISERCGNIDQKTNEILSICKNADMPDRAVGEVDALLSGIKNICYHAGNELQGYSLVLTDVSKNMEIPWPPVYETEKRKP